MDEKEIINPEDLKVNPKSENNHKNGGQKKKHTKLKYVIYLVFIIIVTVVAVILSVGNNYQEVLKQLQSANLMWLGVMLAIMFGSVLVRAIILFFFARLYSRDYKLHQALAVEQIGNFYSAVTPGATGGQFMEAYTFQKQGIQVSNAVSMLAMYSILYQIVLTTFGVISFIVKFDFINQIGYLTINLGGLELRISMWILTIIGFLLNVGVIAIVFLMAYWRGFHNFIMGPCVSLAYKMHIVRDSERARENLRVQVENFKIELRRLFSNIPFAILVTVMFIGFFILRFSLPYFSGLALGNQSTSASFWDAVFLSNYHQMVTGLIPLPGSAGISEYVFSQLFVNSRAPELGFYYIAGQDPAALSNALGSASLLLWRTVSFTLPLIISGFVTAFYRTRGKPAARFSDDMPDRQTMIDIQRETLVERNEEVDKLLQTASLNREAIFKKLNITHHKDEKIEDHSHDKDDFTNLDI